MNFLKAIMISLGTISLLLGLTGIFIPGLPTTPFILLTAALYIRSSDKLYNLLITNKRLGPYILEFQLKKGMTRKSKILSVCMMWSMILISCIFFITSTYLQLIVSAAGIIGTIVMGFIIPTTNNSVSR